MERWTGLELKVKIGIAKVIIIGSVDKLFLFSIIPFGLLPFDYLSRL